ncbi:MAG: aspartate racemase family protein [Candidatus Solibacter sp.]|nr:aspartate racemase family protein [Candidatus Solibacter sp.]
MKTIGLLGGMSCQSSAEYYRIINESVQARLGGHHNARSLMLSVDFDEIESLQRAGKWSRIAEILQRAARQLENGGADFLVICSNTCHKSAPQIELAISIPLLHIADATAEAIRARGMQTVALLGTSFTMEEEFYRGRLQSRHGLTVLIPDAVERAEVHRVIFDELCHGELCDASRRAYQRIIDGLKTRGAEAVVLGCTEISLLIHPADSALPVFDTTRIHAARAVDFALA